MRNTKILKAKCKKTGRWSAMELKEVGGEWQVINMIPLTEEEAKMLSTEIRQPRLKTSKAILPCSLCGNRFVSGCGCLKKKITCRNEMPYQYECIYCPEFQIDYTRGGKKNPYNACAGISNIPDAIRDSYGNPQGSQYDLAEDGSFSGYQIIALSLCHDSEYNLNSPRQALERKGFSLIEYTPSNMPSVHELKKVLYANDRTQLWLISDSIKRLDDSYHMLIAQFFMDHHGVYLWGDNAPYYVDANAVLKKMFSDTELTGNYYGTEVLKIQIKPGSPGIIADHLISTGLVSFYEGITIAHVEYPKQNLQYSGGLEPLMYSSDNQLLAAYYDQCDRRALIDGGFTRLFCDWEKAGTDRYVVNAAAWLANTEYFGYEPQ